MTTAADPPERLELAAGTTVVVFARAGDRWDHELRLADGRVWRSVEGPTSEAGDPRWPASPPLVEVSLAATNDGTAILGVGRAGRSHYSLCVTPCLDLADTLHFDVACRIQEPAGWLGSTYRPTGEIVPSSLPTEVPATVRWSYTVGPEGIRGRAAAGSVAVRRRR